MSKFSGKCDLYDHIMMMKNYPKEDNPNVLISDEMECFELFKEATGGVIYKGVNIQVNEYNQKLISELCEYFTFEALPKASPRHKQRYVYKYFGQELTLKQLNKQGVYVAIPINFETLLDIIPYYPHIIVCAFSQDGKQRITISDKSFVDSQISDALKFGRFPYIDYKKELQKHYVDVVNRYFNPEGRKVTKTFQITPDLDLTHFELSESLDYNWDIEVVRDRHFWIYSSPKIIDVEKGIIDISKVWPGELIEQITLTYVRKPERKLYLE